MEKSVVRFNFQKMVATRWILVLPMAALIASMAINFHSAFAQNTTVVSSPEGNTTVTVQGNETIITNQSSNDTSADTADSEDGDASSLNMSSFSNSIDLEIEDKTFPIKYNITGGKLIGLVADKDLTTIVADIGSPAEEGGSLTIELPRNVIDSKDVGNVDSKFEVKIDGQGVEYDEVGNNLNARILDIDFGSDDRTIEIKGTQIAS